MRVLPALVLLAVLMQGCSSNRPKHQPLQVSTVTAPVHAARANIAKAVIANSAATAKVTEAQRQVAELQTLVTDDLKPRVQLLGAALGETQSQLANEKSAHSEADKELSDSEAKGIILQQQSDRLAEAANNAEDRATKAEAKVSIYKRDLWVLAILAGVALAYVGEKLVPLVPAAKLYLMGGGFVAGIALVGVAHLAKFV